MKWPFRASGPRRSGVHARSVHYEEGEAVIDVRGQTCPGYLLAINRAVDTLPAGTTARLLISYPPCGDDVHAWCRERGIAFLDIRGEPGLWVIRIRK